MKALVIHLSKIAASALLVGLLEGKRIARGISSFHCDVAVDASARGSCAVCVGLAPPPVAPSGPAEPAPLLKLPVGLSTPPPVERPRALRLPDGAAMARPSVAVEETKVETDCRRRSRILSNGGRRGEAGDAEPGADVSGTEVVRTRADCDIASAPAAPREGQGRAQGPRQTLGS